MFDAFSAGVEPGGLRTTEEIKILLCYMLHTVQQPMPRGDVTDIVVGGGMANYFDVENAIEELLRLQHLVEGEDHTIATTVTGGQIGEELSVRVPYTLRERSAKAALELLRRRRTEADNPVTVEKLPEGGCLVTCAVVDEGKALFSVALRVADDWQANQIKEHFLEDPSALYRANLAVLTGETDRRRGGSQLVIKL